MDSITGVPATVRAGDTLKFDPQVCGYPSSDGWTLKFKCTGTAGVFEIVASPDDDGGYSVEVAATTTKDYVTGRYQWLGYVVGLSGERYTLQQGEIEVLQDLAAATNPVDTRSQSQRILDAIDSLIEGRAAADVDEYTIGGRTLRKMSIENLLMWREYYANKVSAEKAASGVKTGGRRILATFGRIR